MTAAAPLLEPATVPPIPAVYRSDRVSRWFGVADEARMELFVANMRGWRNSLAGAAVTSLIVAWAFSEFAPPRPMWVWAGLGLVAYAGEALICLWLERSTGWAAIPSWWLLATGGLSLWVGLLWGSLAWWLPGELPSVQLLAALGSGMVLLGSANASNSTGLLWVVVAPGVLLVPAAMLWHARLPLAGGVSAVMLLVVLRHGLSVQRTMVQAVAQRRQVEALSNELRIQQARLHEAEQAQALLDERQRLLRDMHDGIGSSLVSALMLIEHGQLSPAGAAGVLRECLDDLRLTVDSLEPFGHDLVAVLATLRFRLGERLERAGIAIDWAMADVPPLPWLNAPQALEVLRIAQEVLANIVKHARATRVRIGVAVQGASTAAAVVLLRIEDDGIGFDPQQVAYGRGLAHLRHRAAQLSGRIEIESVPGGGTRVCLVLPVAGLDTANSIAG